MRLKVLDNGYSFGMKVLFAVIHAVTRHPVPDAAKIVFYRPEFYGAVKFTDQAMRGPSEWSVGNRELMAAYVSKMNECSFCIGRILQLQRSPIRMKAKSPRCYSTSRPRPLRSHSGQRCACWES